MSIQHQNLVFEAAGLAGAEKLLLLAYCNYTDAHGYCWAGVERIADDTGTSTSTVKRTRAKLIERGLLGTKRRINPRTGEAVSNLTRVNLDRLAALRRAQRDYDDNVVEAITFAETSDSATRADQQTVQCDPWAEQQRDQSAPQTAQSEPDPGRNLSRAEGQLNLSPNPSVDPSSSSVTPAPPHTEEEDEDGDHARPVPQSAAAGAPPTPAEAVARATGATEVEAQELVAEVRAQPGVRSVARYVNTLIANGDMAERLARLRHRGAPAASPRTELCVEHTRALPCPFCDTARPVSVELEASR